MLCRRHTGRNAPPFEGMDIIISLAVITYITVYINEKPASQVLIVQQPVQCRAALRTWQTAAH